jgi:hypothetical protein
VEEAGRVIRAAWVADSKRAVRMRAWKTELVRAARESKRTGRSRRGRLDERKRPYVWALVLPKKESSYTHLLQDIGGIHYTSYILLMVVYFIFQKDHSCKKMVWLLSFLVYSKKKPKVLLIALFSF